MRFLIFYHELENLRSIKVVNDTHYQFYNSLIRDKIKIIAGCASCRFR